MLIKLLRWLLPLIILLGGYGGYVAITSNAVEPEPKPPEDPTPTVQVAPVKAQSHKFLITSYGEVVPMERTLLSAQVSGEVVSWHPDFVAGGIVKRGEVLFTVEKDNYQAAVEMAEAQVAIAEAALIEERARGKVAEQQARALPKAQVTDLYLRKPQLFSAEASMKSAQAALKRAQRELADCEVLAPYDALVVSRDFGVGQFIMAGSPVATLYNVETAEVHIPIPGFDSEFLPASYQGVEASISEQDSNEVSRKGSVVRDMGVIDSDTRMVSLVVQVSDPYALNTEEAQLPFGSYVEVVFTGRELEGVYQLPQELVNDHSVWVVSEESRLELRQVTVLRSEGRQVLVEGGLLPGDRLVLTVPEYPRNGLTVKVDTSEQSSESSEQ